MALSELASIANLITSVAVLGSLIFLGQQIRQSARNQRSIMDRGRSQQVSDWLQFIASPDIAPLIFRGHAMDPKLTPDEHRRYLWCLYPLLLHYEDSYYQHRERMLGDEQYVSICNQMRDDARYAGFRAAWGEVRDRFSEEFRRFADQMFVSPAEA
ncbi:MAG: hypothetical protein ACT4OG_06300 [Alphaproteobacteria bacterium]